MRESFIVWMIALGLSAPAVAQQEEPLSLQQAVAIALAHNPQHKAALAETHAAKADVKDAQSFFSRELLSLRQPHAAMIRYTCLEPGTIRNEPSKMRRPLRIATTNGPQATSCLRVSSKRSQRQGLGLNSADCSAPYFWAISSIIPGALTLAPGHSARPLNTNNKSERRLLPRFRTPLPSRASPAKAPMCGIRFDCQRCARSRNTRACGSRSGTTTTPMATWGSRTKLTTTITTFEIRLPTTGKSPVNERHRHKRFCEGQFHP